MEKARGHFPANWPVNGLVAMGAALLFGAYWAIFVLTTPEGVLTSAWRALYNTGPAIGLAIVVHVLLDRFVWPQSRWIKIGAHIPAAVAFAVIWYGVILFLRGLRSGWMEGGLTMMPFSPIAFAWQMFQGVTFYALTALASLAIALGRRLSDLVAELAARPVAAESAPSTIIVKTKDETHSVDVAEIICVNGAGDYSELTFADRTLLSTSRLGQFEARLPEELFLRAHRSHLVRLSAITRTEPAGNGRTVLHLENGTSVITSRAGSRLLKEAAM